MIFVQVTWNLTRGVPWIAEQLMGDRVVYYMPTTTAYPLDPRAQYWQSPANSRVRQTAKQLLAPLFLRRIEAEHERFLLEFRHILCVSEASRQAIADELGRDPATILVVNNGVELDLFHPRDDWDATRISRTPAILFAVIAAQHKGVHTVIEALARLQQSGLPVRPTLTIAGSRGTADHEAGLRRWLRHRGWPIASGFLVALTVPPCPI